MKTEITCADLLPMAVYEKERKDRRKAMAPRRPTAAWKWGLSRLSIQNYDTMLHQIHEMLAIEKGGDEQVQDELDAYNPLVPKGRELVATIMFEIEDPARRARELARMGGVEDTFSINVGGMRSKGVAVGDEERTRADGKTSSVHFMRFTFTPEQIAAFKKPGAEVTIEIAHPNYGHMSRLPEAVRAALAADFA